MSKKKTEIDVLRINETTRITGDRNQWIVQLRSGKGWSARSFVASNKRILTRVLDELGRVPDAAGIAALDALPFTHRQWAKENL